MSTSDASAPAAGTRSGASGAKTERRETLRISAGIDTRRAAVRHTPTSHCGFPPSSVSTAPEASGSARNACSKREIVAEVRCGWSPASTATNSIEAGTFSKPACTAASGPPPGGFSSVHSTGLDVVRGGPTTTTGSASTTASSVRSSRLLPSTGSRTLSTPPSRRALPPASTTAAKSAATSAMLPADRTARTAGPRSATQSFRTAYGAMPP